MSNTPTPKSSLVVVANRLPVVWSATNDGADDGHWQTSPGGLVSALGPVMSEVGNATWVGWTGGSGPQVPFTLDDINLVPVTMSDAEKAAYYDGMSNGTLWPLYHDKAVPAEFHRTWWDGYRRVNERFAEAVAAVAAPGATVWVHDYQLQLVPAALRAARPDLRIGFFLHIPFPPAELFFQLPWRRDITLGLLGADLVGFQTPEAAGNFNRVARRLQTAARDGRTRLRVDERIVRTECYPIGIDVERYERASRDPANIERAEALRHDLGDPRTLVLGVDRLDYTKGIDVRIRAFGELLEDEKVDRDSTVMVQVAQPSRDDVAAYVELREEVERLVGEINGSFGRVGFPVLHYIHQSQSFEELLALYRAADVMLVTPFRDGMNLVAKEYVASRFDLTGALVLSEFAGAATELKDAFLVNPHDIAGVKAKLLDAIDLDPEEGRRRMRNMRRAVVRNDAFDWARRFLRELRSEPASA
jgi:trehalose 6-phosphate synthase